MGELPRLCFKEATGESVARWLENAGCVVIEDVVSAETMAGLASDLDLAEGKFYGDKDSFAGSQTVRNAGKPLGESRVAQELAACGVVVDAVKRVLGPRCRRVVLGTCSAIDVAGPRRGEEAAPAQPLHRDDTMWPVDGECCVTVMWAVSDFTRENGATRVVPGSHRWLLEDGEEPEDLADADYDDSIDDVDAIPAEMKAGSVLLFSGSTLHGASKRDLPAEEAGPRRGLLFIYNLGWLRTEHNFHWAIPMSVYQTFSPDLKELLGYVGGNRVEHSWYSGPVYTQPLLGGGGGVKLGQIPPTNHHALTSYARLWACATLLRVYTSSAKGTLNHDMRAGSNAAAPLVALALLATIVIPQSKIAFGTALVLRIVTNALKGGGLGNSQTWATHTDAAILLWLATGKETRTLVKWQLFMFYFASGFWKLNTSFEDPRYSCGSMFAVQLLEWIPSEALRFNIAPTIAAIGPGATLLVEHAVPLLIVAAPVAGVVAAVLFHLTIGITPCPNNVSSFGATLVPRLFCLLNPRALDMACGERTTIAYAIAFAAVVAALTNPLHLSSVSCVQGTGLLDKNLVLLSVFSVIFCRAAFLHTQMPPPNAKKRERLGICAWVLLCAAFGYSFLMPIAGTVEKGGCLMFGQLKLHGGSNHMILPTGALQKLWYSESPETNAFGGGVVRVEDTNLSWIRNGFANHISPHTKRLFDSAGLETDLFFPSLSPSLKLEGTPIQPRFFRYTLSALGLKNLLATARAKNEPFDLTFTPLPGPEGDELWRRKAGERTVHLVDLGRGNFTCQLLFPDRGAPCNHAELALVSETTPSGWSKWLAFTLQPQPNPIVPGHTDEMHCVSIG